MLKVTIFYRSIVFCTTSIIEYNKCSWLEESAAVQGIEPNIQCIRSSSTTRCLEETSNSMADVVRVLPDSYIEATRTYKLSPILAEFSSNQDEDNLIVGLSKQHTKIRSVSGRINNNRPVHVGV